MRAHAHAHARNDVNLFLEILCSNHHKKGKARRQQKKIATETSGRGKVEGSNHEGERLVRGDVGVSVPLTGLSVSRPTRVADTDIALRVVE